MKKKIVLFGTLPIATEVCKLILEQHDVELTAVVLGKSNPVNNDPWPETPLLQEFCLKNNIKTIDFEKLSLLFQIGDLDFGISCRFNRILKKEHLRLFKNGVINFHGGLLPEFGGLYSSCHTILEESSVGGGTIHFMDEGIDTGHILSRSEFPIEQNDTTGSVFKKTQLALYESFKQIFPDLISDNFEIINQKDLIRKGHKKRYFDKNSLEEKKKLTLKESEKYIDKIVRAFDFPAHEPAYFTIGDKKFYVRTNK